MKWCLHFQSPFVVISVVGQELLQAGQYQSAVTVLESALRIGSCSPKLRGSVFSALSSAHWAMNQLDKAIGYMQQDLAVAKSLGKLNQHNNNELSESESLKRNNFVMKQATLLVNVELMET